MNALWLSTLALITVLAPACSAQQLESTAAGQSFMERGHWGGGDRGGGGDHWGGEHRRDDSGWQRQERRDERDDQRRRQEADREWQRFKRDWDSKPRSRPDDRSSAGPVYRPGDRGSVPGRPVPEERTYRDWSHWGGHPGWGYSHRWQWRDGRPLWWGWAPFVFVAGSTSASCLSHYDSLAAGCRMACMDDYGACSDGCGYYADGAPACSAQCRSNSDYCAAQCEQDHMAWLARCPR